MEEFQSEEGLELLGPGVHERTGKHVLSRKNDRLAAA
jgi:hypothetical protein